MIHLVDAKIFHARVRPKRHAFSYRAPYLALPVGGHARDARCALFSRERFNLFSFRAADHGDGTTPLKPWIDGILREWKVPAGGEVLLVTLPRVLGYVFNPVSFWFCFDGPGALRAVLAEVNNTFGERHCYLCCHEDRRPIAPDDWLETQKVFYVSPFMKVEGFYRFRFAPSQQRIAVQIDHGDGEGLLLSTSVAGSRRMLTSWRAVSWVLRHPLLPLRVIGLIYWQALRLLLKGLRHTSKPAPPASAISR